MSVLGLDIGGANLKAADTAGQSAQRPFAIWKSPDTLADELRELMRPFIGVERIAVTMTAELADCYRTKQHGVRRILDAVQAVAGSIPVHAWTIHGELIECPVADDALPSLAASNWHALATWLALQFDSKQVLLMDIGTTTTDIIPLGMGQVLAKGKTDFQRLVAGELVYTGIRRTPLCAVAHSVTVAGVQCPLSSELFATMLDVYLMLKDLPEAPDDGDTSNGRPATRDEACDRLVRQLCCDRTEIEESVAQKIARDLADQQERQIGRALQQVLDQTPVGYVCQLVVVSGSGRFLAERVIARNPRLRGTEMLDISEILKPAVPEAACAYAVAKLGQMRNCQ